MAKSMVPQFYQNEFWDVIKADLLNSQKVANRLFEQSVNSNPVFVIKNLQNIMNALATIDSAVIDVDGKMGPATIARCNALSSKHYEDAIEFALRSVYLTFLLGRAQNDKTQRVFTLGWINREAV
jgi:lysozyme family protein